jgi:hypothetical protein
MFMESMRFTAHCLASQDNGRDAALDSLSAIVRGMASGHVRQYLQDQKALWEVCNGCLQPLGLLWIMIGRRLVRSLARHCHPEVAITARQQGCPSWRQW